MKSLVITTQYSYIALSKCQQLGHYHTTITMVEMQPNNKDTKNAISFLSFELLFER